MRTNKRGLEHFDRVEDMLIIALERTHRLIALRRCSRYLTSHQSQVAYSRSPFQFAAVDAGTMELAAAVAVAEKVACPPVSTGIAPLALLAA